MGDRGRAGTNAAIQSAGADLVVLTTDGDLLIVKRTQAKYEELRRYKVGEGTGAHPFLLGRDVVIRDAQSIAVWTLNETCSSRAQA